MERPLHSLHLFFLAEGEVTQEERSVKVKGPLAKLFNYLHLNRGENLFLNGGGKLLSYELTRMFS